MALALVSTIGGATANTYNSLAELEVEAGLLLPPSLAWENAQEEVRIAAAIGATRVLDQLRWVGERAGGTQALEHPRSGLPKPGGWADYLPTEIAVAVKRAHARLTFFLVEEAEAGRNPFAGAEDAGLASISFGSELAMTFEPGTTSVAPLERFLRQVIRPMLRGLILADQARAVRG